MRTTEKDNFSKRDIAYSEVDRIAVYYGGFMNKAISYRYEQEEQMRELQESRRSIQYRYDCRTYRGSDERQNNIGEILEDVM